MLDFQIEMMKNGHFRAHFGLLIYPFLIFDLSSLKPEDIAGGMKSVKSMMFENERFKKVIKKELELFLHKGYLDG